MKRYWPSLVLYGTELRYVRLSVQIAVCCSTAKYRIDNIFMIVGGKKVVFIMKPVIVVLVIYELKYNFL